MDLYFFFFWRYPFKRLLKCLTESNISVCNILRLAKPYIYLRISRCLMFNNFAINLVNYSFLKILSCFILDFKLSWSKRCIKGCVHTGTQVTGEAHTACTFTNNLFAISTTPYVYITSAHKVISIINLTINDKYIRKVRFCYI